MPASRKWVDRRCAPLCRAGSNIEVSPDLTVASGTSDRVRIQVPRSDGVLDLGRVDVAGLVALDECGIGKPCREFMKSTARRSAYPLAPERQNTWLVFKLSGRSISWFFGVIPVGRQHSVSPANPGDPAV